MKKQIFNCENKFFLHFHSNIELSTSTCTLTREDLGLSNQKFQIFLLFKFLFKKIPNQKFTFDNFQNHIFPFSEKKLWSLFTFFCHFINLNALKCVNLKVSKVLLKQNLRTYAFLVSSISSSERSLPMVKSHPSLWNNISLSHSNSLFSHFSFLLFTLFYSRSLSLSLSFSGCKLLHVSKEEALNKSWGTNRQFSCWSSPPRILLRQNTEFHFLDFFLFKVSTKPFYSHFHCLNSVKKVYLV